MENLKSAIFGGGCFWCTESIFKSFKGVVSVTPGYIGGTISKPTYEQVCGGNTGHAEAVKVIYDPGLISYHTLLTVFFATHNPTTLNRQGADVGTQYRSSIFYGSDAEKQKAEEYIKTLENSAEHGDPIVTTLEPESEFYEAEDYHKDYFSNHPENPYCQIVINPKLEKVQKEFSELLK